MIAFLQENYRWLIVVVVGIIEVLIFFLAKKRPSLNLIDRINSLIDDALPAVIRLAEASCSDGKSKMALVVRVLLEKISKYDKNQDETYWSKVIIDKAEAILSCPQKKEIV